MKIKERIVVCYNEINNLRFFHLGFFYHNNRNLGLSNIILIYLDDYYGVFKPLGFPSHTSFNERMILGLDNDLNYKKYSAISSKQIISLFKVV
jgi:hypothetical protein